LQGRQFLAVLLHDFAGSFYLRNVMDQILGLLDPFAAVLVFGGAMLITALRSPGDDFASAFRALIPLCTAKPDIDAAEAMHTVGTIEAIAQIRTLAQVDRVNSPQNFLCIALKHLADANNPDCFVRWAREVIEARTTRHQRVISVWGSLADVAPMAGMVGTIIGLVGMFGSMDEAEGIGSAMAMAMLTTLYGIILGGLIAGPIAARLSVLSDAEILWQKRALERLEMLAKRELDGVDSAPVRVSRLRNVA
jgi:chemotaxis protein MotA